MNIMAVDPSTTVTGWAIISVENGGVIGFDSGFINATKLAPREGMGYRLYHTHQTLQYLAKKFEPIDSIGMEGGFVGGNSSTSLVIGYARAVVLMVGAGIDKPVTLYAPATIKKQIAGTGRATKQDVNNAVRGLLQIQERVEENEADALAIGLTHLLALGAWDRMQGVKDAI